MPSIVEAAEVVEAFSRLRASAADRIERSCTRLEKDMMLIDVEEVRQRGRLDGRLRDVGDGVSGDAQVERLFRKFNRRNDAPGDICT